MVSKLHYENENEMRQHLSAIHLLSQDSGVPEEDIRMLYEQELDRLKERARIKDFLSVLVSRRIKERIQRS